MGGCHVATSQSLRTLDMSRVPLEERFESGRPAFRTPFGGISGIIGLSMQKYPVRRRWIAPARSRNISSWTWILAAHCALVARADARRRRWFRYDQCMDASPMIHLCPLRGAFKASCEGSCSARPVRTSAGNTPARSPALRPRFLDPQSSQPVLQLAER